MRVRCSWPRCWRSCGAAFRGLRRHYLRGGPRIIDATSYWLEARALSEGHLAFAVPEPSAAFRGRFLVSPEASARLAVIFPPGYPAILAVGFWLGAPLAVGPLIAAALVVCDVRALPGAVRTKRCRAARRAALHALGRPPLPHRRYDVARLVGPAHDAGALRRFSSSPRYSRQDRDRGARGCRRRLAARDPPRYGRRRAPARGRSCSFCARGHPQPRTTSELQPRFAHPEPQRLLRGRDSRCGPAAGASAGGNRFVARIESDPLLRSCGRSSRLFPLWLRFGDRMPARARRFRAGAAERRIWTRRGAGDDAATPAAPCARCRELRAARAGVAVHARGGVQDTHPFAGSAARSWASSSRIFRSTSTAPIPAEAHGFTPTCCRSSMRFWPGVSCVCERRSWPCPSRSLASRCMAYFRTAHSRNAKAGDRCSNPQLLERSGISRGLIFVDTDHGFNLGHRSGTRRCRAQRDRRPLSRRRVRSSNLGGARPAGRLSLSIRSYGACGGPEPRSPAVRSPLDTPVRSRVELARPRRVRWLGAPPAHCPCLCVGRSGASAFAHFGWTGARRARGLEPPRCRLPGSTGSDQQPRSARRADLGGGQLGGSASAPRSRLLGAEPRALFTSTAALTE